MAIKLRNDLPQAIRDIENVFITLSDSCRLAARIWLPEDAEEHPVPAILEYLPYRKRDFMRVRDEPMHRYYAGHGYASIRVDLRGSGDSDGILQDEYLPQEQQDAIEVIDWLARQSWCSGEVGMTGISWGGFNSLQVAAHAPKALKAIITLCSSDDRYADDAHYMGGCLLNENQNWGTALFALNALPPDPDIVGERWREMWLSRLQHNRPFPAVWLEHQHRDGYWQQGSVCESYADIQCAVYAIGGWADGYSNTVSRLMQHLQCPRKGLIGPWAHTFPHNGVPGPAIGYLQEAVRWWNYWLKNEDNGIMDEPLLRVWMQESMMPTPSPVKRKGHWITENEWPASRISGRVLHLNPTSLQDTPPSAPAMLPVSSPQTTGSTGGDWCGFGAEGESPMDQRADDGRSLVFDSEILAKPIEILGAPKVFLKLSSDSPLAQVAVRLTEVHADGISALVSYGVLNLTHRDSHEHPQPVQPGCDYEVCIQLNDIAHRFSAGHCIRLAISTNYWPLVWPAPRQASLSVHVPGSYIELPVRQASNGDESIAAFPPAETANAITGNFALRPQRYERIYERDLTSGAILFRMLSHGGDLEEGAVMHLDSINLDLGHTVERRFSIAEDQPTSARAEISEELLMRRRDWKIRIQASTQLHSNEENFYVTAQLTAYEGDECVFIRKWNETIRRNLV